VQVPMKSSAQTVEELAGKRIVTSFDNISKKYFNEVDRRVFGECLKERKTEIKFVSGSVEIACALGLADGIVDLVESGETMRAAGLRPIATLFTTEAVLIANPNTKHPDLVQKIASRIKGVVAAQHYVLCEYNVPREKLKQACAVTPGNHAPTISPLEDAAWVAVSSMVEKSKSGDVMDKLYEIGARDIIVFSLSNCRV